MSFRLAACLKAAPPEEADNAQGTLKDRIYWGMLGYMRGIYTVSIRRLLGGIACSQCLGSARAPLSKKPTPPGSQRYKVQ